MGEQWENGGGKPGKKFFAGVCKQALKPLKIGGKAKCSKTIFAALPATRGD